MTDSVTSYVPTQISDSETDHGSDNDMCECTGEGEYLYIIRVGIIALLTALCIIIMLLCALSRRKIAQAFCSLNGRVSRLMHTFRGTPAKEMRNIETQWSRPVQSQERNKSSRARSSVSIELPTVPEDLPVEAFNKEGNSAKGQDRVDSGQRPSVDSSGSVFLSDGLSVSSIHGPLPKAHRDSECSYYENLQGRSRRALSENCAFLGISESPNARHTFVGNSGDGDLKKGDRSHSQPIHLAEFVKPASDDSSDESDGENYIDMNKSLDSLTEL